MTLKISRRRRSYERIPGYEYSYRKSFRLGEFDIVILKALATKWGCSDSEAIRRSIIYTFTKLFTGAEKVDEEAILRALNLAYEILRKTQQLNNNRIIENY